MSHKSILPVLVNDISAAGMVNIQILLYKMNVKLRVFKQSGILLPLILPVVLSESICDKISLWKNNLLWFSFLNFNQYIGVHQLMQPLSIVCIYARLK